MLKLEKKFKLKFKKSVDLMLAGAALITMSACGVTGTDLKTVSSFCQTDRTISLSIAPSPEADDIGNKWDSEDTRKEVVEHNQAYRAICPE